MGEGMLIDRRRIRVEEIYGAVHDHTSPVERALDLIDFKGCPTMMRENRALYSARRAAVDPAIGEHIVDRLDVDAGPTGVRDTPHVVTSEKGLAFGTGQISG